MNWREKLGCVQLQADDRSDKGTTSVTSVPSLQDPPEHGDGLQSLELPEAESAVADVRREISRLLAKAYRRHRETQRPESIGPKHSDADSLANLAAPSVHGVVP